MDCSVLLLYRVHLYSASACVLLTLIAWVAHRYKELPFALAFNNILLGSFQLFLHSDLLFWGWNNPVQRCLPVGEVVLSTFMRWFHALDWMTALMCNRRRPQATLLYRASFSALASANSFVYFCIFESSNITLTHLHVSNCRVQRLQFSGIFVALGWGK